MKQKTYYSFFILLIIILGCSKEESESSDNNSNLTLNLSSVFSNSYSANLGYDYSSNAENVKLIWNITNEVDLNNKIGEKNITTNNSDITINNLEQNQTYFFRLTGNSNNETYYSEIVTINTSEIEITFNNQILSSIITNGGGLKKIIKRNDGYLLFTTELVELYNTGIRVSKTDNQLNLLWTFVIDETNDAENLSGVFELNNDEYIAIAHKFSYTNFGLYNNEVYGFKFNNSGNLIWNNDYSANNVDANTHFDLIVPFSSKSNDLKVLFKSDSTYYASGGSYYRELHLNPNGQIISNSIIGSTSDYQFQTIAYSNNGSKYNYGGIDILPNDGLFTLDGMLQKFDPSNNLLLDNSYGNYGADDYIHKILIADDGKITMIGKNGHENGFDGESRWVLQTDENDGEIIWDFKESRNNFLYQGRDLTLDEDGNYLSLFFDIYYPNSHVYNLATLIKSDSDGNIIWKFVDGEDFNDDSFSPVKVFREGNEYLIFGIKDGSYLWLKKIKVD
ncbi:hypothetical protein DMZ43_07525 [Meridianimaribacter sp. CL38]|uniref:hypothetical protein n=1 Tax=Meridianimaribacter sp. CL38 TaxID=2213021 RepID=UPI00103B4898|nr:hypothetical protein [Meridianimaribacter sp. CL38]TBV26903.1 hypothetical protein DMZ43_07525 [Meridianimaribacter sp. CL38]